MWQVVVSWINLLTKASDVDMERRGIYKWIDMASSSWQMEVADIHLNVGIFSLRGVYGMVDI